MFYGKYNKGEIRIKEIHTYFSSFFHLYEQILKAGKQPACHMEKLVLATIYLLISLVNYERVLWRKFFFKLRFTCKRCRTYWQFTTKFLSLFLFLSAFQVNIYQVNVPKIILPTIYRYIKDLSMTIFKRFEVNCWFGFLIIVFTQFKVIS